jgi:threonine dehydrogenase-like Zn-dependent dehydrogenase
VLWSSYLHIALSHGVTASNPAGDPLGAATATVLGYGVTGALVIVLAFVLYRGTFTRTSDADARLAAAKADADARVAAARVDLLRENEELRGKLTQAERELREAINFTRDQWVPLLQQFVSATGSLLPILQRVTARYDELPSRHWEHDERERR